MVTKLQGSNPTQPNSNQTQRNPTEAVCFHVCTLWGSNPTQLQPNSCCRTPTQPNLTQPNPTTTPQRQYVGISRWRECVRHGWDPKIFDVNLTWSKVNKKTRKTRRVDEKIPRPYKRITVVPPHRVGIVYPPLEVMRQAVQQRNNKRNKQKNKNKNKKQKKNINKTERIDKTKQAGSPPPRQSGCS